VNLEGALIEVPVVVADRTGHYIPNLTKRDFQVLEDNQPQDISFFSTERVPIHVALVMDTSGSTRGTIQDIQEAAISFINQLLPGDNVLVVSFASEVIVEQEFTNDRGKLIAAVRRTQAVGATKLYEAAYLTVAERLQHIEGRKAMIILSDGEDTASHDVSFEEAVTICQDSDVVVYGIRYPDTSGMVVRPGRRNPTRPRSPRIDIPGWLFPTPLVEPQYSGRTPGTLGKGKLGSDPFMESITEHSGGTLFYANAIADVSTLFATIAEELRHIYTLGYAPTNPLANGGYRRITVRVPNRPELAVRHRLGYKAEAVR
jgi:VWFA-related protein